MELARAEQVLKALEAGGVDLFNLGNGFEYLGNARKTFFFGGFGEGRVDVVRFLGFVVYRLFQLDQQVFGSLYRITAGNFNAVARAFF